MAMTVTTNAQEKLTKDGAMKEIKETLGFVPNLMEEMSVSPATSLVYVRTDVLMHNANMSQKDQQIVQLVVSLYNECGYCTSAHSKLAEANGVSHADVLAIRKGTKAGEKSVNDLVWLTTTILEKRGHLSKDDLSKAKGMGYGNSELYEILVHVGRKMIANYAVHITHPEIDEEFAFTE